MGITQATEGAEMPSDGYAAQARAADLTVASAGYPDLSEQEPKNFSKKKMKYNVTAGSAILRR